MAKKVIINNDLNLKLLCKELYKAMGYCTHFEIQLRTKSYINTFNSHDISDIDVFGYKFNSDLSLYTIGAECKSGETGALDELFKFLGIYDYYKLDRGYLLKTKIHQNARQVAIKNGLICFTESEIRQILLGHGLDLEREIKISNAKYLKLNNNLILFKKKNDKLIDYIKLDFWNRENWRNIHNIIHMLSFQNNEEIFQDEKIIFKEKQVYYYILELFTFSLLKNVSQSMVLNYSDISNSIINNLYGGAESLYEKRKVHDLVSQATSSNKEFEPEWQYDLVHISSRLSESTYAASRIPELIQELVEGSFYDNKVDVQASLLRKYPDLTRKFTQDIIYFLEKHCNIKKSIFEDFMKI